MLQNKCNAQLRIDVSHADSISKKSSEYFKPTACNAVMGLSCDPMELVAIMFWPNNQSPFCNIVAHSLNNFIIATISVDSRFSV